MAEGEEMIHFNLWTSINTYGGEPKHYKSSFIVKMPCGHNETLILHTFTNAVESIVLVQAIKAHAQTTVENIESGQRIILPKCRRCQEQTNEN